MTAGLGLGFLGKNFKSRIGAVGASQISGFKADISKDNTGRYGEIFRGQLFGGFFHKIGPNRGTSASSGLIGADRSLIIISNPDSGSNLRYKPNKPIFSGLIRSTGFRTGRPGKSQSSDSKSGSFIQHGL